MNQRLSTFHKIRMQARKFKNWAVEAGFADDACAVGGCPGDGTDIVTLQPLDPIDHVETVLTLCPEHQEWAEERNQLAETVTDELREARKDIGQDHYDAIKRLARPDGPETDAVLMGEYDTLEEARRAER